MIIETWIAIMFLGLIIVIGFVGLIGWSITDKRLEEANKENFRLSEQIRSRDIVIEKLNSKILLRTATDFYNEGKKK